MKHSPVIFWFGDRRKLTASRLWQAISASEVKEHNKPDSAWVIVDENVYDVTDFL